MPKKPESWDLAMPSFKETSRHFESLFDQAHPEHVKGTCSTLYSSYNAEKTAVYRINERYPNCRFIFIARNPVERVESSYREMHNGDFGAPFELDKCMDAFPVMVRDSCYTERIARYRQVFKDDQIHVLFLEDLIRNTAQELKKCFRHIHVDPEIKLPSQSAHLNPGRSKYYDSRFYRHIKSIRLIQPWVKNNGVVGDTLTKCLGLRRPFRRPINWNESAISILNKHILPDTTRFLEDYGKVPGFWPNPYANFTPEFKYDLQHPRYNENTDVSMEDFVPVVKPNLTIHPVSNGYLVYDDLLDQLHQINHSAGTVLSLCHDGRTCADIANTVKQKFKLEYIPAIEVMESIDQLSDNELLVNDGFNNL